MKISEIGEFGLIDMVSRMVEGKRDKTTESWKRLLVGIGDDAALWKGSRRLQVATTDSLVEGVHFSVQYCDWESLGWKSLAINLSDIAAMGGIPLYALVSLSLPGSVLVKDITSFYNGMLKLCKVSGTAIAGGNFSSSNQVVITLTVFGEVSEGKNLLRSGAEPGDVVALTGYTGLAAAGLEVLQGKKKPDRKSASLFTKAFLRPEPRLKEAAFLASRGVKAAVDISDGLLRDLSHICQSSKVEVEIDLGSIPVHPALRENFGRKALSLALEGGEDYELLFTASEQNFSRVERGTGCPVTVIGRVTGKSSRGKLTLRDEKGRGISWEKGGWEHFQRP